MKTLFNSSFFRKINWQTIVLIGLALALGMNVLFGRTSLREAKKLTKELEYRIDTLEAVEIEYRELEEKYTDLYTEFSDTRKQLSQFKKKLAAVSEAQNTSLRNIRTELKDLVETYDSIDVSVLADTVSLDSLRF